MKVVEAWDRPWSRENFLRSLMIFRGTTRAVALKQVPLKIMALYEKFPAPKASLFVKLKAILMAKWQ